jgi:hypothetical protein
MNSDCQTSVESFVLLRVAHRGPALPRLNGGGGHGLVAPEYNAGGRREALASVTGEHMDKRRSRCNIARQDTADQRDYPSPWTGAQSLPPASRCDRAAGALPCCSPQAATPDARRSVHPAAESPKSITHFASSPISLSSCTVQRCHREADHDRFRGNPWRIVASS